MRLAYHFFPCVALLTGCSVLDPLKAPDIRPLPTVLSSQGENAQASNCTFAGCMDKAIEYTEAWRQHYYGQAAETLLWRNAMLAPILPLSANALYRSTHFENSTKLVGGYAAVGGVLYGLPQFFGSTKQQQLYLAGSRALTCALIDSRSALVAKDELTAAEQHAKELRTGIAEARRQLDEFRNENLHGLDPDEIKAISAGIIQPVLRRIAYYVKLEKQVSSIRSEVVTSGELLRRQTDLIISETAKQIVSESPQVSEILALSGGIKVAANTVGQGAYPPPPAAADVAQAEQAALAEPREEYDDDPDKPGVPGELALAKVRQRVVGSLLPSTQARIANAARNDDVAGVQRLLDGANKRLRVSTDFSKTSEITAYELVAALKPSPTVALKPPKVVNTSKKSKPTTAAQDKKGAAQPTPNIFDQMLGAMRGADTLAFTVSAEGGALSVKGEFKVPKKKAKEDSKKTQMAQERAKQIADWVRAAAAENTQLYKAVSVMTNHGEALRFVTQTWKNPKGSIDGVCEGDKRAPEAAFSVSPASTEVTLKKGGTIDFVVLNGKEIPTVTIGGQNSANINKSIAVSGESFVITITAVDVIPDGKEAILVIADKSGKRKTEIKFEVTQ
jgi:hypothetical protein